MRMHFYLLVDEVLDEDVEETLADDVVARAVVEEPPAEDVLDALVVVPEPDTVADRVDVVRVLEPFPPLA